MNDERILARCRQEENRQAFQQRISSTPESMRRFTIDPKTGDIQQLEARLLWNVVTDVEQDDGTSYTYTMSCASHSDACAQAYLLATSVRECTRVTITVEAPSDLPQFNHKLVITGKYFDQARANHEQSLDEITLMSDYYDSLVDVALANGL